MPGYKWKKKKKKAYVVFYGLVPGIYATWVEVKKQVDGFSDNSYLGYFSIEEAEEAWEDHLVSLEESENSDNDLDLDDRIFN